MGERELRHTQTYIRMKFERRQEIERKIQYLNDSRQRLRRRGGVGELRKKMTMKEKEKKRKEKREKRGGM